ncbi:MAG: hypothetical protein Kow0077_04480 [Anaerolineae bacterium]
MARLAYTKGIVPHDLERSSRTQHTSQRLPNCFYHTEQTDIMEEQTLRPAAESAAPEALSWQFIVLLVAIAALIPLLANSFIQDVQRAEKPIPTPEPVDFSSATYEGLAELPLTQTFEGEDGVNIQYPESWSVLPLRAGFFVVSNYELDPTALEFPPDIVLVQVQSGQLDTFTMPDGSPPAPGTEPLEIMQALTADSTEPVEVTPLTVDGSPAASVLVEGEDSVRKLVMITPTDTKLVIVDVTTADGMWPNVETLVSRMVESMTFVRTSD